MVDRNCIRNLIERTLTTLQDSISAIKTYLEESSEGWDKIIVGEKYKFFLRALVSALCEVYRFRCAIEGHRDGMEFVERVKKELLEMEKKEISDDKEKEGKEEKDGIQNGERI
ncbi:MAG: hypothetical protein DRN20_03510 [Thermoplasmata archaeon]|nr:MAG: hypothetical protein DRN20_03510 [Thermoplasmata archaeon]